MSDNGKEARKKKAAQLKALREERQESVKRAQALLKEQNATRKIIREAMVDGPKTVPELAEATGMPADEVLWHMSAMKKYGLVVEEGADDMDEYYLYGLAEEEK
jgi:predicted transcriptional regulator